MSLVTEAYRDRGFWMHENSSYSEPNFRMKKCAKILNQLTAGRPCTLLDVGCGPAALRRLLDPNITYHGIDIALHESRPYLKEVDFLTSEISFGRQQFDLIVALGVMEYMGSHQSEKFREISRILRAGGKFCMSYINFGHCRKIVYPIYNNVMSIKRMKQSMEQVFRVEQCFPLSHHWRHKQPGRRALPSIQIRLNWKVPLISPWLAVEYLFICSHR